MAISLVKLPINWQETFYLFEPKNFMVFWENLVLLIDKQVLEIKRDLSTLKIDITMLLIFYLEKEESILNDNSWVSCVSNIRTKYDRYRYPFALSASISLSSQENRQYKDWLEFILEVRKIKEKRMCNFCLCNKIFSERRFILLGKIFWK